jgi:hypothetical protein
MLCQRLTKLFFHGGAPKVIFPTLKNPPYENEKKKNKKTKRQLLTHGDYSSIASCHAKILAIFPGMFGISRLISKILFVILLLPAEPQKMFCGILGGKHCVMSCVVYNICN